MKTDTSGNKVIALPYSGGIDSTALIGYTLENGDMPFLINIDYGAANNWAEEYAMEQIANWYAVRGHTIRCLRLEIDNLVMFAEQVSRDIPTDSFEEMGKDNKTIFPGRNALLISMVAAAALARNIDTMYIGMGWHDSEASFPDCGPDFIYGMKQAMYSGYEMNLILPYYHMARSEVIQLCYRQQVPLHLTRSCYRSKAVHCGRCATCYSRQKSFSAAGFYDPTSYQEPFELAGAELEVWDVRNW